MVDFIISATGCLNTTHAIIILAHLAFGVSILTLRGINKRHFQSSVPVVKQLSYVLAYFRATALSGIYFTD